MTAEDDLVAWARVYRDRDRRVREALAAGVTKHRIHTITGISRATIDRLLTKESTVTTTTEYGSWGRYFDTRLVEDMVTDYLGEFAGDFDVAAVADAFRDAINEQMADVDVVLRGPEFYGPYPKIDGAEDRIRAAVDAVDLGDIVQRFEQD